MEYKQISTNPAQNNFVNLEKIQQGQMETDIYSYSNVELLMFVGCNRHKTHPDLVLKAEEELTRREISDEDEKMARHQGNYEVWNDSKSKNKLMKKNGVDGRIIMVISFLLLLFFYTILLGIPTFVYGVYKLKNSNLSRLSKAIWISSPIILWIVLICIAYVLDNNP